MAELCFAIPRQNFEALKAFLDLKRPDRSGKAKKQSNTHKAAKSATTSLQPPAKPDSTRLSNAEARCAK